MISIRSSRPDVFSVKDVLKIDVLKWDFNKVAKQHECSPVNLLHIFRILFSKNTSGWLLSVFMFDFIRELKLLNLVEQRYNQKIWNLYFYLRKSGHWCKEESYFCIVTFIACIISTIIMCYRTDPFLVYPSNFHWPITYVTVYLFILISYEK